MTDGQSSVRLQTVGVLLRDQKPRLLKDWEVILALNEVLDKVTVKEEEVVPTTSGQTVEQRQQEALHFVQSHLAGLELPFQVPTLELLGTLWH